MSGPSPSIPESPAQHSLFEKLFEASPDAIVVTDADGRITSINSQVDRLFGYVRQELIGQDVEILVPERFRKAHPGHRGAYKAQASVRPMGANLELFGRCKDGTEFPVDIMLSPMETPGGRVVISVIRDISDRKKAQEALRRSEQQFRALFEFSPDAIIASDREGRITEVNPRVESTFGYDRGELLGQSIDILVPERFRRTHPARREEYAATALVRPMGAGLELYGRRKDGSEFPVDIMLSPMETADGRVVISVIRDISDRKKAQEAIRRSEAQFRALFEFSRTRSSQVIGKGASRRSTPAWRACSATLEASCWANPSISSSRSVFATRIRPAEVTMAPQPACVPWVPVWNSTADARMGANFPPTSCSVRWKPRKDASC